ncbi:MAG: pyridoxamine 5'-phosphate oxidase family protein [Muribaculaceae bacterium]|nr:pyridoxamine 5'-phosphate oxidase family protein [Muribaculaceae bacterium]
MDILQEIKEYLAECKVFYLATVDGDNARVRPFGVSEIYNGRLYFMTAKNKDVFKQLVANPKFEVSATKANEAEWIRVSGKLVNDDDLEMKQFILDQNPELKQFYQADDNMAALYITDGEARFFSYSDPERRVKF